MKDFNFLWDHFKFNADQRLKTFNFFVLFTIFADGGILTAIEKNFSPYLLMLLGLFIIIHAIIFWILDIRSKALIDIAVPGLKKFEKDLNEESHLFFKDSENRSKYIKYTIAFRMLFLFQITFGLFVIGLSIQRWSC